MKSFLRFFYIAVVGLVVFTGALMIVQGVRTEQARGAAARFEQETVERERAL